MQILKDKLAIDFMSKRYLAAALSGLMLMVSIGALVVNSLNFGIDFTGGTLIEVGYPQAVDLVHLGGQCPTAGLLDSVAAEAADHVQQ